VPRLFIALLLASLSLPLWADDLFQQPVADVQSAALQAVVKKLAPTGPLRSDFVQQKNMRLLSRPLVSKGAMIFSPGLGLYWQQRQPFALQMLVSDERIVQESGGQRSEITRRQQPAVFAFSRIFFRLLSGNLADLEREFTVFYQPGDNGHWRMGLVPKDAQLRAAIARIELAGSDDLDQLTLQDHAGDYTQIRFENRDHSGAALSAVERAYFAQ
jgi:hypothetical protein